MSTAASHSTALLAPESSGALAQQVDHLSASQWYTAEQVAQRVQLVQQIFRNIMIKDVHYGVIPGCDKPTLYKPGSELLLMAFRIAVTPRVDDLSTEDCARYRVTIEATHAPSGLYLGSGIGEASTSETKYKWRKAVCEAEFDATPADRRQIVWKKGERGAYSVMQVRTNVADVANTALKIGKKRSQIDLTLTVTGCSDMFSQDLEDLDFIPGDDGTEGEGQPQQKQPPAQVQMPQRRQSAPASEQQQNPDAEPIPGELQYEKITQPAQQQTAQQPAQTRQPQQQRQAQSSNFRGQQSQQHREQPSQSARTPRGEKISEGKDRRFFAICMGNGITKPEMNDYLQSRWGISNSRDIIDGEMYEECIRWAEGKF